MNRTQIALITRSFDSKNNPPTVSLEHGERGRGWAACHARQGHGEFEAGQFAIFGDGGSGLRFHPRIGGDLRLGPWPTAGRVFTTFSPEKRFADAEQFGDAPGEPSTSILKYESYQAALSSL